MSKFTASLVAEEAVVSLSDLLCCFFPFVVVVAVAVVFSLLAIYSFCFD